MLHISVALNTTQGHILNNKLTRIVDIITIFLFGLSKFSF